MVKSSPVLLYFLPSINGISTRRNGTPSIRPAPSFPQHPYQQALDAGLPAPSIHTSTVRTWTDYSRVFYHPRSIVQINDYELASSLQPFERWENGEELFGAIDREEGVVDRDVRRWVEECDTLQGVQIIMGADDAWGGFGKGFIEGLRDEVGKGEIWVWGLEEQGSGTRVRIFCLYKSNQLIVTNRLRKCSRPLTPLKLSTRWLHKRRCSFRLQYLAFYRSMFNWNVVRIGKPQRYYQWRLRV